MACWCRGCVSHFSIPAEDPGAFDGQSFRSYNVAPHALMVNFRTVHFDVQVRDAHAEVLVQAWRSPWMPEFVSSLPIAGIDGTMRRRLKASAETGRMHVKTGRLDEVSAVAGYVHGADGCHYIVVSIFNHPQAHRGLGEQIHDAVLRWTYRQSRPAR